MTTKALADLSDDELEQKAHEIAESRATSELQHKAAQKAVQAERDRRSLASRIAAVDPDVVAAIRASKED